VPDGGLRGKARFTQPTKDQYPERKPNLLPPLKPQAYSWFQPGGRHISAGVRKPPDTGNNTAILYSSHAQASISDTSQFNIYLI
jgi:hypothetical protein